MPAWILLQRLDDDGTEHQLVGVDLFGLAIVQPLEHLFHLMLKGDVVGVRIKELPITPEKILNALEEKLLRTPTSD